MENIVKMDVNGPKEDIGAIVALHRHSFTNVLIGQMGEDYLQFYYKNIINNPAGVIYIYKMDSEVAGFLAGISTGRGFYTIKYYQKTILALLKSIIQRPSILVNLVIYIYRNIIIHGKEPDAELLSIAVDKQYQGRGIGTLLVKNYETWLMQNNTCKYKVYTDTNYSTGNALYEKLGFQLSGQAKLFGIEYKMYRRDIL